LISTSACDTFGRDHCDKEKAHGEVPGEGVIYGGRREGCSTSGGTSGRCRGQEAEGSGPRKSPEPRLETRRRKGGAGATAAAASIAVNTAGGASAEVVVLLTPEDVDAAAKLSVDYRPPGS
jgi:hypothetical protein